MEKDKQVFKGFILVIDDDPLLIKTVQKALQKVGYVVETANNGYQGIEKARSGFYHLILCDVRMPGLDGLMTIQHIREFQKKAGAGKSGFVVITAYGNEDLMKDAVQLGVTDYLSKPFDFGNFLEVIDHNIAPIVKQHPPEEVIRLNQKLAQLPKTSGPEIPKIEKK